MVDKNVNNRKNRVFEDISVLRFPQNMARMYSFGEI
jgi:hypothetical protein